MKMFNAVTKNILNRWCVISKKSQGGGLLFWRAVYNQVYFAYMMNDKNIKYELSNAPFCLTCLSERHEHLELTSSNPGTNFFLSSR